jgi:hypothetical protein
MTSMTAAGGRGAGCGMIVHYETSDGAAHSSAVIEPDTDGVTAWVPPDGCVRITGFTAVGGGGGYAPPGYAATGEWAEPPPARPPAR